MLHRPVLADLLGDGTDEGRTNRVVVVEAHPVAGVPGAQTPRPLHEIVEILCCVDEEHELVDELALLVGHGRGEQRPGLRSDLEQRAVERVRERVGVGADDVCALGDESEFLRCHVVTVAVPPTCAMLGGGGPTEGMTMGNDDGATRARANPPPLPVERGPERWRGARLLALGLAQALALLLLAGLLDSLEVDGFLTAFGLVVVLGVLSSLVWPIVVRFALPLVLLTVGLFTFVLNAAIVWLAGELVGGVYVRSFTTALGIAFVLSVVNLLVGGVLRISDDHVHRRRVVGRMVRRLGDVEETDVPGFLFIQIDGLGHDVLEEAIESGHAPFLARLVDGGTHRLLEWECDLSSQTGAMQAGILLGDNSNMPAFRWYEKETGKILVSNRPQDAAELEERQSSGVGLLVDGGASRGNVFSGDAPDTMFTFSTVMSKPLTSRREFAFVIATPYALFRIIALMVVEIVREWREAWTARRNETEPSMHRGGIYPILRAGTTVALSEVTLSLLMADILQGYPSAYVDLVGYDEVAHHSGIRAPEALDVLRRADDQLARLLTALDDAPRPYYLVVLSDHGQTQGATFLQRYDESLPDCVRRLAEVQVAAPVLAEEGWNNVNGLLTDAVAEDSRLGKAVKRVTKSRQRDGEVVLGPDTERDVTAADGEIIVLASGNLGLVSFPSIPGRATLQDIEARAPALLEGLRTHPGIGFVLVRDEVRGDVVLGPDGLRRLDAEGEDAVVGTDPLLPFGANAARHLRRTSGFVNCPDLVVNSFYDVDADEGAAFEELIGFHGGLGGDQGRPFVLAPSGLEPPEEKMIGAEAVHGVLKGWLQDVQQASVA